MPNYSFGNSGMHRKQNFEITGVFFPRRFRCPPPPPPLLPFAFSSSPFLLFFFPVFFLFFFFSFIGHLLDFLSVGKGFAKSSKIVNFFGRKYEWVVGQDFRWYFLVKVTRFFASFSGCLTKSRSFGHILKDLFSLYKLAVKVVQDR